VVIELNIKAKSGHKRYYGATHLFPEAGKPEIVAKIYCRLVRQVFNKEAKKGTRCLQIGKKQQIVDQQITQIIRTIKRWLVVALRYVPKLAAN
jgi:hypothetical protein